MSTVWWTASLSSLLGGALGAFLTLFALRSEEHPVAHPERQDTQQEAKGPRDERQSPAEDDQVLSKVRTLEHRVSLLAAALRETEERSSADGDGSPAGAQVADVADPVFEAAVLDVMDRERERKDAEETTYRKQLRTRRSQARAAELGETLGLDGQQQEQIAQAVTEYFETMRSLRDEDAEDRPVTRKQWQERMTQMNQRVDDQLREILGPEKYSQYDALDPDDKLGFGRGRRGER